MSRASRRFFACRGADPGEILVFPEDTSRHISRVLRLRPGEMIRAFDAAGNGYEVELTKVSSRSVEGRVISRTAPAPAASRRVVLASALLRAGGLDGVLRQAVELGLEEFIPLVCANCVALPGARVSAKVSRWRTIAREAARQSGQPRPPEVSPPRPWEEFVKSPPPGLKLMAWEGEKATSLRSLLMPPPRGLDQVVLLTGPEGGFSREEVAEARQAGFVTFSLGPSTLRAVTAPLAALAALHALLGK